MTTHTILFLAANPSGTHLRALDREAHSIRAELKRSGYRDRFKLETRWAAAPLDLLRELRELQPAVVHFSGHGGQNGLFFQTAEGRAQVVSPAALAETFGAAGASVKLVVLSACYGEAPAEALLAHVDCVVGVSGALYDDMARAFAIGFYGALGDHASIAEAYRHGNAAISLEGLSEEERPRLKVRNGVDAAGLVLAAAAPELHVALPCPYPGMRPYSADDADRFHGREVEIDELLGRLRAGEREIYVIGPSGSGKSSLVGAGVLPRLARGVTRLGPFLVRSMRPGERPAARLGELLEVSDRGFATPAEAIAALLARRALGASVLIVVDQLEELFTLADAGARAQFVLALHALRTEPRCVVVCTLRADFFGAFMESPLWTGRPGRLSRIEVDPLRGQALNEAIVRPARELGVRVEPELVERLLADAGSEPGVLPLLQETLVQLWDRRQGKTLTLANYRALGERDRNGLAVALARRADAVLRTLTPAREGIARRILLRLISFGEGRSDTRRQQPRSKLRAADDDAADFDIVLQRLIAGRLLTADDDDHGREACIDLAHEVMIASWPTLAGWIQTHRVGEQRRRQLEVVAARWVERGRGARGLLDPIELADAEAWQQTESARQLGPSTDVAALVGASRAAHAEQRRRRRYLVWGTFAALAIFAVIVVLAVTARDQAREAEERRRGAQTERAEAVAARMQAEASDRENRRQVAQSYQETGRRLLLESHAEEALPYLMAARKIAAEQKREEGESLRMLISAAAHSLPLAPLKYQAWNVSAAFSPDGARVVTVSDDRTARIWEAASGKPLAAPFYHQKGVRSAAFSPDGTRVVTAGLDATARVWDAISGKPLTTPLHHQAPVASAVFSPDGIRVVTASLDATARVWNATSGKPLTAPLHHQAPVASAVFSPDGTRVVTASDDSTARVWDAASGKPLTAPLHHQARVASAVFSPDGTRVVTASDDRTARVWNAASGKPLVTFRHQTSVRTVVFSPDATRIVTVSLGAVQIWDAASGKPFAAPRRTSRVSSVAFSSDGTRIVTLSLEGVQVWDATSGQPLAAPLRHSLMMMSGALSPDGTRVVTTGVDNVWVWDVASGRLFTSPLNHQAPVVSAAFSPDGTRVVTASQDKTARVWDATSGKPLAAPLPHQAPVVSAAFSPDGTRVVTASQDKTARVWDATSGKPFATPLQHQAPVVSAAFSPDGTHVVTASQDKTARVWDATSGKPFTALLQHQAPVVSAAFSPDGTRVVTASQDKTARVWNATSGQPLTAPLRHQAPVASAVFSPDGTRLVTASEDKTAQVWDAASGKPLITLQHQGSVTRALFSPDGARVITACRTCVRVWDAASGKPLAAALQHRDTVASIAFSPDGTRLVTASEDKTAQVWDAVSGQPLAETLEHEAPIMSAAFSPDGTRVVTVSINTMQIWETPLDYTAPNEWPVLAARSPFILIGGTHHRRTPDAP